MTNLTVKQEKFCQHYAAHGTEFGNGSDAYRHAYDTSNMKAETIHSRAYDLLQKSEIKARIAELQEEYAKASQLTAEYVLNNLMKVAETCLKDGEGFNPAGANKALELLGKYKKMFTDVIERNGSPDTVVKVAWGVVDPKEESDENP